MRRLVALPVLAPLLLLAACRAPAAGGPPAPTVAAPTSTARLAAEVRLDGHPRALQAATGTVDFDRRHTRLLVELAGARVEHRSIGHDRYLLLPGATRWLHVDARRARGVNPLDALDPVLALAEVAAIAPDRLHPVRRARVRGTDTTHYRVGGTPALELWLDEAGRVRRLRRPTAAPSGRAGAVLTLELFDLGRPVRIEAPED